MNPDVIFYCRSSSVLRFNMLCMLRCFLAHHVCETWLLGLLLARPGLAILFSCFCPLGCWMFFFAPSCCWIPGDQTFFCWYKKKNSSEYNFDSHHVENSLVDWFLQKHCWQWPCCKRLGKEYNSPHIQEQRTAQTTAQSAFWRTPWKFSRGS